MPPATRGRGVGRGCSTIPIGLQGNGVCHRAPFRQGFVYPGLLWLMAMSRSALALVFVLAVAAALPAHAEQVLFVSKKPYWSVGVRDPSLSRDCSLGRFNVRRSDTLVARFAGKEGADTLGIAKGTGLNLYDPTHKAKPTEDYYFRNHNTTSCEVFVGGRKGGAAK